MWMNWANGRQNKVEKQVIKVLSKYTLVKKGNISADSKLEADLGITSMDFVSIVGDLEDLFGIQFDMWKDVKRILTVQDIIDYINSHNCK